MNAEELAVFIQEQRRDLFGSCAVISVCAQAAIDQDADGDELADALRVARQMVDGVAAKLEALTKT